MAQYTMPAEWEEHAGTWLQWPHDYTYGPGTRDYFEQAWIDMTLELLKGEEVYIIAYNEDELTHIQELLYSEGADMGLLTFYVFPNDDYWVRDNGPLFVKDDEGSLFATDWGFDGWGNDAPYELCDLIPGLIGSETGIPVLDVNELVLEGGAIEHDGNGTFMATESSILGDGRNPGKSREDVEEFIAEYLGSEQFIWLEGAFGGGLDITDQHIDGFLRFHNEDTIVTMSNPDLNYWFVNAADRSAIASATNKYGEPYDYVYLPLTDKVVRTTDNVNTGSKGSYVNYYVGNAVALVPIYNDDNDSIALNILQEIMPDKEVVGIDCRNMFLWGGMVHCVTQQQPAGEVATGVNGQTSYLLWSVYPNPASEICNVRVPEGIDEIYLSDINGKVLAVFQVEGEVMQIPLLGYTRGTYFVIGKGHGVTVSSGLVVE